MGYGMGWPAPGGVAGIRMGKAVPMRVTVAIPMAPSLPLPLAHPAGRVVVH